jgi:hypothetical protein
MSLGIIYKVIGAVNWIVCGGLSFLEKHWRRLRDA